MGLGPILVKSVARAGCTVRGGHRLLGGLLRRRGSLLGLLGSLLGLLRRGQRLVGCCLCFFNVCMARTATESQRRDRRRGQKNIPTVYCTH